MMMNEEQAHNISMEIFGVDVATMMTAVIVGKYELGKAEVQIDGLEPRETKGGGAELIVLLKDNTWFLVKPKPDLVYTLDLVARTARMIRAQKIEQVKEAEKMAEEVLRRASGDNGSGGNGG